MAPHPPTLGAPPGNPVTLLESRDSPISQARRQTSSRKRSSVPSFTKASAASRVAP